MILEFLTEEDAKTSFNFNSEEFNKFKSHPLFDSIEVKKLDHYYQDGLHIEIQIILIFIYFIILD